MERRKTGLGTAGNASTGPSTASATRSGSPCGHCGLVCLLHVERTNRWFRKRQKTHYRNRKERTIRNMLKADLVRWSDRPVRPNRLCRKNTAAQKQVA